MNFSQRYRHWLIWTLLAALLVAGGSFSVAAVGKNQATVNHGELPETRVKDLPAASEVAGEIHRTLQPARGTMNLNWLERALRWALDLWEKWRAWRHPDIKSKPLTFQKALRWMAIPIIIIVIGSVFYLISKKVRRDVRESALQKQTADEEWRVVFRRALAYYPSDPGEAIHLVVKAIIRRFTTDGNLKEDPTLTLREIEHKLMNIVGPDNTAVFSSLRRRHERIYYGNQPVTKEEWEEILQLAGILLGEVPAP